jgi:hypothetical protein
LASRAARQGDHAFEECPAARLASLPGGYGRAERIRSATSVPDQLDLVTQLVVTSEHWTTSSGSSSAERSGIPGNLPQAELARSLILLSTLYFSIRRRRPARGAPCITGGARGMIGSGSEIGSGREVGGDRDSIGDQGETRRDGERRLRQCCEVLRGRLLVGG